MVGQNIMASKITTARGSARPLRLNHKGNAHNHADRNATEQKMVTPGMSNLTDPAAASSDSIAL
jgi:hypothetical protein